MDNYALLPNLGWATVDIVKDLGVVVIGKLVGFAQSTFHGMDDRVLLRYGQRVIFQKKDSYNLVFDGKPLTYVKIENIMALDQK